MSKKVILRLTDISKQYRLGLIGTGTISHDLNRWWHKVRGKEDPYLKIGESNDRSTKGKSDYVWALKDINFEVKQGEVLGIIGKNGAGKSTLLKILSKVTGPTTGEIKTRGRIASLLEVGTGFHGEMTGRENIYLNGAILGMTKSEITTKLDQIIAFSGCERYVDTPVKRYSSGMTVRLAFAVAAFLEPEILVIDEVLAVGDAEFQKKAVGKMQDISRGDGRTVLFVSHNMASIQNLCTRTIVIENGTIIFDGDTSDAINFYYKRSQHYFNNINLNEVRRPKDLGNELRITDVICNMDKSKQNSDAVTGKPYYFNFVLKNLTGLKYNEISLTASVYNRKGNFLFSCRSDSINKTFSLKKGEDTYICCIPKLPLNSGEYYLNVNCSIGHSMFDYIEESINFNVHGGDFYGTGKLPAKKRKGVFIDYNWL
ncbi:ABC transporter ATP-binding protein [Lacinutrix salivirga]